jgi:hypothetical protein
MSRAVEGTSRRKAHVKPSAQAIVKTIAWLNELCETRMAVPSSHTRASMQNVGEKDEDTGISIGMNDLACFTQPFTVQDLCCRQPKRVALRCQGGAHA